MSAAFDAIAFVLSGILLALASLHLYWAFGGRGASLSGGVPTRDGIPLFQPGPLACVAVAVALLIAASFPLLRFRLGLAALSGALAWGG